MKTAKQVDELVVKLKNDGIPLSDAAWQTAVACVGWPYVFGAWGAYCTPAERRKRYRSDHPTIKTSCKNFNGDGTCHGCKWFPNDERTRCFDCRGFTDWVLKQFGIDLQGEGATSQWNTESNWLKKGTIDTVPDNVLVCLFYPCKDNPKKMAHTGLSYKGETCECSSGVQHFTKMNKKWTHWAIPKGICKDDEPIIPSDRKPTLRKGDKGEWVTLAQTKLKNKGYDLGKCGVDGDFGKATEAAVKQFQQDWGLTVDGIIGDKTWELLDTAVEPSLYTVTVPHLTLYQAEALMERYPGSYKIEEKR